LSVSFIEPTREMVGEEGVYDGMAYFVRDYVVEECFPSPLPRGGSRDDLVDSLRRG
jgi:hypothetical protein